MCEWLSSVEWCDVRLSCGGRTLNAHRAVLASVSLFLRRVLLSCPQEETPTFIVLPDFDLEALSSALYYAYNGEVVINKDNLQKFLDVMRTLEIFIDQEHLQEIGDCIGDRKLDLCTNREKIWSKSVFSLSIGKSDDHEYVNIRKGEWVQDLGLRYSQSVSNLGDKQKCLSWSYTKPSLDNPPASHRDRQRSSFLRDLYIETYSQNGNVNGLTGGVLAIPNERYRAPTSVLLTNANGKLLGRADETHSEISRKTTAYMPNNRVLPGIQNSTQPSGDLCPSILNNSSSVKRTELVNTKILGDNISSHLIHSWPRCYPSQSSAQQYQKGVFQNDPLITKMFMPYFDSRSLDLSISMENSQKRGSEVFFHKQYTSGIVCNSAAMKDSDISNKQLLKGPIFNHVMNSPWCPKFPYDYKPFRRKVNNSTAECILHKKKDSEVAVVNDTNNNIEDSLRVAELKNEEIPSIGIGTEQLKCNFCSQVFTSPESLQAHTKRHASAARYSCAECGKTFSQLRNFKYHMSVHRGTREFAATCTVCGKYFNDRGYLSSHMKIHRNRKEYKCSQCPKSFNQRVAYNMHVRIHTGVKPHVCEECGKAFSRKMLLKQHQRTHSGERPYACPHCDKRFADRSNMTLHLRLHTGIKPFSCTLCPKSFTKKHHLKSHLNFHTGAKPYSCPRCKLAFTQSSNMRTHFKKCNAPDEPTGST